MKKKNKKNYIEGGLLGFVEAASPLLNLIAPGLGTAVGTGANVVDQLTQGSSPSTYTPVTPNTNKYGLQNGGPVGPGDPPDSTYAQTQRVLNEFPIPTSEAMQRRATLIQYNNLVKSQEAIPQVSGRLIPQGRIQAYHDYAIGATNPTVQPMVSPAESTNVQRNIISDKPKFEKGGPMISKHGWDYSRDGDKVLTRKTGSQDWVETSGTAREAIIKKHFPDMLNAAPAAPAAPQRVAPPSPLPVVGKPIAAPKEGGKLSDKVSVLVNEGYPQKQAVAIAYDMQRKGKLVDGGTLQPIGQDAVKVKAHNPNQSDSVELDQAYVDHNEVIARLKDVGKYVFPSGTINPITGNTFAKDAERITKANAKAEAKPYDKEAQAALKRNNETLSNYAKVNEMLKGIETGMKKLKKGGKLCRECGGKMGLAPGGPLSIADLINIEDSARVAPTRSDAFTKATIGLTTGTDMRMLPHGSYALDQSSTAVGTPFGLLANDMTSRDLTGASTPGGAINQQVTNVTAPGLGDQTPVATTPATAATTGNKFGLGEGLQLGELAAKALLMARGYDKQPLHQLSSPITQASYDPTQALQQANYGFQTAADQVRNTTSRSGLVGNIQQLAANQARNTGQIQSQYDQMNRQARTQYEGQMAQREAQNTQLKMQNEQIRQQDEAQFFNNLDTLLTSAGNYGRAKVGQQTNQKAVQLLLQAFPDIAKYINV